MTVNTLVIASPRRVRSSTDQRIQKACVWCGVAYAVLLFAGLIIAGWLPPPSPSRTAAQVGADYSRHSGRILVGVLLMSLGTGLFAPFVVGMSHQLRRIGEHVSALATVELICGSLAALQGLMPCMFWASAAYRPERSPEITQSLDDMAWLPFAGVVILLMIEQVATGVAVLSDRRQKPLFPRWVGYLNFVTPLLLFPASFDIFVKSGPLAWDGIITFWIPVGIFGVWYVAMAVFMYKAADRDDDSDLVE